MIAIKKNWRPYRKLDFGLTQSMTVGSNLNPFSKEKGFRLQYFGSEGVYLDRDDTGSFRKMLFFLIENGFEYDDTCDRWFRPKDRARYRR